MAFVKLDCGMLDSTLWVDREARELFVTALLMAEPIELKAPTETIKIHSLEPDSFVVEAGWYGFVPAASTGIIRRCGIDQAAGMEALGRLSAPDKESRTPDHEGRRMVRIDGGFIILNYDKYRQKDHSAAIRMRNHRERKKSGIEPIIKKQNGLCACCSNPFEEPYNLYVVQDHCHTTKKNRGLLCQSCNKLIGRIERNEPVNPKFESLGRKYLECYTVTSACNAVTSRHVTQAEAEAEAEGGVQAPTLESNPEFFKLWGDWKEHLATIGRPMSGVQEAAMKIECQRHGVERSILALKLSIQRGYKNIFFDHEDLPPLPQSKPAKPEKSQKLRDRDARFRLWMMEAYPDKIKEQKEWDEYGKAPSFAQFEFNEWEKKHVVTPV